MLIDVIFSVILENVKHAAMITQVEKKSVHDLESVQKILKAKLYIILSIYNHT